MNIINKALITPDFGKEVKKRLIDMDKSQKWLIDELHKRLPHKYIDRSNLNKILKGEYNSPEIVSAIKKIIGGGNHEH